MVIIRSALGRRLKKASQENKYAGLNLLNGKIEDTLIQGIIEPLKVKTQAITLASEVAIMILRIDDVIAAKRSPGNSGKLGNMAGYD